MRVLVVDAGNSKVVMASWQSRTGAEPERLMRLRQDATPSDSQQLHAWLATLSQVIRQGAYPHLILASVVPSLTAALCDAFPDCVVIDHNLAFPFGLGVDEPAGVGADRYCNMAAAVQEGYTDALVIDLGTATTFDLLSNNVFVGGLIAPGMALAASKLGEQAARLWPVDFAPCPLEVGTHTEMAMRVGSYHVAVRGVISTAQALLARYGERPVILTGGLARFLEVPEWQRRPDWTLAGAIYLGTPVIRQRASS